jgi:hypothetical protein
MTRKAVQPATAGTRNGLSAPKPYVYRGDQRAAEVAATIATVRARLLAAGQDDAAPLPPADRCDDCGYLVTAPGHLAECGDGQ